MALVRGDNSLYFSTGLDTTGLTRDSNKSVGIIKTMATNISKLDVFAGIAVGGAIAFSKISKEAKEFSSSFEQSMLEVKTISKATQKDFEGISESVIKLSKKAPQSAEELAGALYQIVSAGYDGSKGLLLLDKSSKAAVAGVTDVKTAADGLTTILNAWQKPADESEKVLDQLFKTVEGGKTTFEEISNNISQVAPLAAALDIELEEVLSSLATITKQGTPTSVAFTQITSAIVAMNENFGESWRSTMTLQEGFEALRKKAEETGKQLTEITGRKEGALATLALTGKNAKMAASDLDMISKSAGASSKAFSDMVKSDINQGKLLQNNINALLKPLGDGLITLSTNTAKSINKIFRESGNSVEDITSLMAKESFKIQSIFGYLKNAENGSKDFANAIEQINKEYGDYLPNLLTQESSLIEIEKAQKAVTQAMLANVAVQQVQASITDKMTNFADDFQNAINGITNKISKVKGPGMSALFIQAVSDGLDEAISKGEADLEGVLKFSNTAYGIYSKFLKQTSITFEQFQDKFFSVIKEKQKLNNEITELSSFANAYEKILERFNSASKKKVVGEGGPITDVSNLNEYQKLLTEIETIEKTLKALHEAEGVLNKQAILDQKTKLELKQKELDLLEKSLTPKIKRDEPVEKLTTIKATNVGSINSDDFLNINEIESKIDLLYEFWKNSDDQANRDMWAKHIIYWEGRLDLATDSLDKLRKKEEQSFADINSLSLMQLLNQIAITKKDVDSFKSGNKEKGEDYKNLIDYQKDLQNKLASDLNRYADLVVNTVNSVTQLAVATGKMTDEQAAKTNTAISMVSDTVGGVTSILSGDLAGGISQLVSVGIQGLIMALDDADKGAKGFMSSIEKGNKAIEDQSKEISRSRSDTREAYAEKIKLIEDQIELTNRAIEAEYSRRKADQDLITSLKDDLDSLTDEMISTSTELGDILSGGITQADIAGRIGEQLSSAKGDMTDFADFTNSILQDAVMGVFENAINVQSAKDFLENALADTVLTDEEIAGFNQTMAQIQENASLIADQLNFDKLFGDEEQAKDSLAGAIKRNITEETASMLEGIMRQLYVVTSGIREAIDESNIYLSQVANNTESNTEYLPYLRSIDEKLSQNGISDRAQGL